MLSGGFQTVPIISKPMFAGVGIPAARFGSMNQSADGQITEPAIASSQVFHSVFSLVSKLGKEALLLWHKIANPPIIAIIVRP